MLGLLTRSCFCGWLLSALLKGVAAPNPGSASAADVPPSTPATESVQIIPPHRPEVRCPDDTTLEDHRCLRGVTQLGAAIEIICIRHIVKAYSGSKRRRLTFERTTFRAYCPTDHVCIPHGERLTSRRSVHDERPPTRVACVLRANFKREMWQYPVCPLPVPAAIDVPGSSSQDTGDATELVAPSPAISVLAPSPEPDTATAAAPAHPADIDDLAWIYDVDIDWNLFPEAELTLPSEDASFSGAGSSRSRRC